MNRFHRLRSIFVVGCLIFAAEEARAQTRSFAVGAGVFNFDLSGTGNAPLIAMSTDWRVTQSWIIEAGLTVAFPDQQFDRTKFFIPEVQVQYQWVMGRWAPFVGGGIGAAIDVRDDFDNDTDLALAGGGGVRVNLTDSVGIRGDFRLRGFEPDFGASAAELRGGVFWRF